VQFTASAEFRHKLERLQALMGSRGGPQGCDLAAVIEQAVTEKLERLEARCFARPRAPRNLSGHPRGDQGPAETDETETHPSPSSRHIPAAVRSAVYERDRLQFHHQHPFGLGGGHSVQNIRLMCRAHNAYLAECDYGREKMARHQRPRDRASQASACQQAP
jgi:5-methylcytosine-specific restriction endonuclease McrA